MKDIVQKQIDYYYCDNCNGELDCVPIEVNFGYGNHRDGKNTHFCSDGCLIEYLNKTKKEIKSECYKSVYGCGNKDLDGKTCWRKNLCKKCISIRLKPKSCVNDATCEKEKKK